VANLADLGVFRKLGFAAAFAKVGVVLLAVAPRGILLLRWSSPRVSLSRSGGPCVSI